MVEGWGGRDSDTHNHRPCGEPVLIVVSGMTGDICDDSVHLSEGFHLALE